MSRDTLRCYVERRGTRWTACCVDVDLAASGATAFEARERLDGALERYCHERNEGAAKRPRAPLSCALKYWGARLFGHDTETRQCYQFHKPPALVIGLA